MVQGRRSVGLIVGLLTVTLFLTASSPAAAAKGDRGGAGGGSSSLSLVLLDPSDGLAHVGQHVTFTIVTAATATPFVSLNCYQSGVWVYTSSAGFFAAYPWPQLFTLSSTMWMSGDADCSARLYSTKDGTRTTTLATLAFHVAP